MNLIWHIIKKDFSHNRLAILLWASSGIWVVLSGGIPARGSWMQYELMTVCVITHGVLLLALLASIHQEDNVVDLEGFIRTRPIAPGRLLSAKLGLVLTLFVAAPLVFFLAQKSFEPVASWAPKLGTIGSNLTFIVLGASAVAACCKNLSRYFLGLFAGLFCFGLLRLAFSSLIDTTPLGLRVLLHETKFPLIALMFSGFWAGALYSIYYRRRLLVAICFVAVGVAGSALMSDFLTTPLPH